jgi:protein TonB
MSIDNNASKQKQSVRWLWLAVAAVVLVVLSAVGRFFVIPLIYPSSLPQEKMAQTLVEPPPPPPPPPPVSSSPQPLTKVISGHPASQSPAHLRKVTLSAAVADSLLIQKSIPMYPPIAKAARVSGTVVLHAVISTSGSVINLRVISGPPMLQQAALDAVQKWKYRPYLLNNEPVEFETTVNVIFSLNN